MKEIDVQRLESGVKTLQASFAELSRQQDWEELIPIWRRPGWTTPAEFILVAGTIESMVNMTNHLIEMKRIVIDGSREVSVER
jgi:hypothetical protein